MCYFGRVARQTPCPAPLPSFSPPPARPRASAREEKKRNERLSKKPWLGWKGQTETRTRPERAPEAEGASFAVSAPRRKERVLCNPDDALRAAVEIRRGPATPRRAVLSLSLGASLLGGEASSPKDGHRHGRRATEELGCGDMVTTWGRATGEASGGAREICSRV